MSESSNLGAVAFEGSISDSAWRGPLGFVRAALLRARGSERLQSIVIPAPLAPAERLLGAEPDADAVVWSPAGTSEVAGIGSAAVFTAAGESRFDTIRQRARELWATLDTSSLDARALTPRLYGGFAFQAGRAKTPIWERFGEARFVLPQICYVRSDGEAWLNLVAAGSELTPGRCEELTLRVARCLEALNAPAPERGAAAMLRCDERPMAHFTELIAGIQQQIAQGRLEKVVAARRVALTLDREVDPRFVLGRLREKAAECTRFAFRVGGATFLGATPERLLEKRGLEIRTEAVAGSMRAEDASSARRLLESPKDIREHEFVVRELMQDLAPLTSELAAAPAREIHQLRHVLHLRTKIRGRLREARHVLEIVARLHPTPAVGGVPTREAVDFIAEHEPDERGWYAGPVGWFDASGDGEFAVALRSGVLAERQADLYVGAGIVQDSDALNEFAETRWKLEALLEALGVQM
jgi:isochorismate synthase